MFSTVLVATSGSDTSTRIVSCLDSLKQLGTRKIVLVHVLNVRDVGGLYHRMKKLILPTLERQEEILTEMGFDVEIEVPLGIPSMELDRVATERDVSLIVTHATAETLMGETFSGGVTHELLSTSEKPVLVMKARMVEDEQAEQRCEVLCEDFLEHVLYPTDFSDTAEGAFKYVDKFVETGGKKVTLLHVQEKARIEKHLKDRLDEFNEIDQERLERLENALGEKGDSEVDIEIPYGEPKSEIVDRTRNEDISLVVMGSQGRGFVGELFLGSVSHAVARHAPVPVLLVPGEL